MNVNKLLVVLAFSMLFSNGVAVAAADFDKGMDAYDSGDYKTALAEWTPLAERGDADAQYGIGYMYAEGEGVLENDRTAAKWLTLAAEQGDADAQIGLAVMFHKGEGVLENNKTAYKWAKLAAAQGNAGGNGMLGMLALEDKDNTRAYMWFSLAIYHGADETMRNLKDAIKELMTSADVDMAQQMASRCLESGYTDCWMMGEDLALAQVEEALDSLLDDSESLEQQVTNGQAVASAVNYMKDEISKTWTRPANSRNGMEVELVVHLIPTGEVVDVEVSYRDPSATDAFVASVVNAVKRVRRFDKLSQLDPELFDANFRRFTVRFKPEDLRL